MSDEQATRDSEVRRRRTLKLAIQLFAVAMIIVVVVGLLLHYSGTHESTTDAYVTGHLHPLAARVTGTVIDVLVDDNQHVHAGDVLVRLDPEDFRVRQRLADAQIAQAVAQVAASESQMAQARASMASARATLERTRLDLRRATDLVDDPLRGISRQDYDAARAARDAAVAALDGAQAQLKTAEANRSAGEALIRTGEANRHDADLNLNYTEIRAPVNGYVGRKTVETGARINAGQTLLSVVEDYVWVVANYKETQLRGIAVGMPASMSVDALPGTVFHGKVDSFSPASGAQFALLPPDNATGNFTKVVQRVPVKIRFDRQQLAQFRGRLMPGLSVVTRIEVGRGERRQTAHEVAQLSKGAATMHAR